MSLLSFLTVQFALIFVSPIDSCQWSPARCGCARKPASIHQRIVGGVEAVPHSWPWIVSVRRNQGHICGGVVIDSRHVLSAAHCFRDYDPRSISLYSFVMGHHERLEKQFVSNAKQIVLHKSFNSNGRLINDIALIELERTIDFTNDQIGFICLPLAHVNERESYPAIGSQTWVVGWGALYYDGISANRLMQVSVPITNNLGCRQSITEPAKQVCAGYDQGGKDSCQGDSGGPLLKEIGDGVFELIGIVSFGAYCAERMRPGIYTRVSGYIDWIKASGKGLQLNASPDGSKPTVDSLLQPLTASSSTRLSTLSSVSLLILSLSVTSNTRFFCSEPKIDRNK